MVDVGNHLCTIHFWHFYVHQHEGWLLIVQDGECINHMIAGEYLPGIACYASQHFLEKLKLKLVVIENQNLMVGKLLLSLLFVV